MLEKMPANLEITIQKNGWHNVDVWDVDKIINFDDDEVVIFIKDAR